MKPRKKNNFFTFIFSFCPGAAEMYMGFMKNGFSILAVFLAAVAALEGLRADFFLAVAALIYIFAFFHARNVAKLDDESFAAYEDKYIWEEFVSGKALKIKDETMRKILAVIMIIIGLGLGWNYIVDVVCQFIPGYLWSTIYPIIDKLPSLAFAVVLVVGGILLISGKKHELSSEEVA